ncbi:hypothetical protein JCM10213_001367 [Rhodosporidiobolus nylandii]
MDNDIVPNFYAQELSPPTPGVPRGARLPLLFWDVWPLEWQGQSLFTLILVLFSLVVLLSTLEVHCAVLLAQGRSPRVFVPPSTLSRARTRPKNAPEAETALLDEAESDSYWQSQDALRPSSSSLPGQRQEMSEKPDHRKRETSSGSKGKGRKKSTGWVVKRVWGVQKKRMGV